nr:NBS-containing resistance-like protein [Tanacetum cinerariifolium]
MKVLQNMESIRARFFNGADVNSKKPSWVRWKSVLAAKDVGGLGVSSLFALNRALMFKWVWRFFSQKNSLWVRVVKALHGEDEKIGKKVQPRYPSTWLNNINEIESLKLHGIDLYRGVANAFAETCWLRNLLHELHTHLSSATIVHCDNVSTVYLSSNPVQHQRMKHIEIDIHFVRDLVVAGQVRYLHVSSHYQCTNIFTKRLPSTLF